MPFPPSRRTWSFLLLDAFVLLTVMGVFAAVNHANSPASALSERILITPEPGTTPEEAPAAPLTRNFPTPAGLVPQTIAARPPAFMEAGAGDAIDPKRLICRKVTVSVHKIALKENYWLIAKNNHIDVLTLIGANPDMPFKARVNQTLNILSQKGVLVTAAKDDTPSTLAQAYGVEEKALKEENGLSWWHGLKPGDVLFIPGAKPVRMTKEWHNYLSQRGLFWDPLGHWGKINSPFSFRTDPLTGEIRHHNGVDLKAKYGDPVYAAASGTVIFCGINGGYGNLIQIKHSGDYLTYYGHLSKIYAKEGQRVRRGTLIGRVGATGRVTGPHLHFEIHKNGKAVDPLLYI
jgi:murein DD-endopeptidase MepM/ murein hydrolase activator NlpD